MSPARTSPTDRPARRRGRGDLRLPRVAAVLGVVVALAACGGDDDAGPRRWGDYNRERTGWTAAGRRAVEATAARLAEQLGCGALAGETFEAWARTYRRNGLPLPLAAGTCDLETGDPSGEPEVVLMEAFGTRPPQVADAVAARADLVCARVTRAGLPGQPYVVTRTQVLIQPDRPDTARRIAGVFPGSTVGDVCPKASKRFFGRSGTTTTPSAPTG